MDDVHRAELRRPAAGLAGNGSAGGARRRLLRWAPIAVVALALVLLYAFGVHQYLTLAALRRYQDVLLAFVAARPVAAALAYLGIYIAIVAVSFPGSGIMTIAGGVLFGTGLATALASLAAWVGATIIFLIARTSFGALLAERAGPRAQRLRRGFQEEGFSYLLFLRLVPIFPFWLVNLAAALFGMRLLPYLAATAVGVVPAAFVFAYFGAGLGSVLHGEAARVPTGLLVALGLLGLMALLPVILRRRRRGTGESAGESEGDRAR